MIVSFCSLLFAICFACVCVFLVFCFDFFLLSAVTLAALCFLIACCAIPGIFAVPVFAAHF